MSGADDDDDDGFAARVGAGAPASGAGSWDDDDEAPEFSDEDLALRFAALHVYTVRYVASWGRWFKWTGKVWEADEKRVAFSLSRQVVRAAARESAKKEARPLPARRPWRRSSGSPKPIRDWRRRLMSGTPTRGF
jgi:hypothetical protein